MLISVVINVDSRFERSQQTGLFSGVVNYDFLTDGVYNKKKLFEGFETELIVFIDEHNEVSERTINYLRSICQTVVIRKHTSEEKFNDYNYLSALQLARGEIIFHFDADVAAFVVSPEPINALIGLLDQYDFISYPSLWSPNPVHDLNYDYWWVSTRFFVCKRESLRFSEIDKCLRDYDYLYNTYPASVKNPWLEHILGLHAKYLGKQKGVLYPRIDFDNFILFTWENYEQYILTRLNEQSFEEVRNWVIKMGGISYPNNLRIR